MSISIVKQALGAALTVGIVVTGAGCSSPAAPNESSGTGGSADASEALLPPAEGETQYPLTWTTWFGEQTLEARPERIAVASPYAGRDVLQVLDVTPVYALKEDAEETPWRDTEWAAKIEVTGELLSGEVAGGFNVEEILATDPDVIIAIGQQWRDAEAMQKLSEIAPVIESDAKGSWEGDWRDVQRLVGEALDLAQAAEAAIASADAGAAKIAADNPQFQGVTMTFGVDYFDSGGIYVSTVPDTVNEEVFSVLGFKRSPTADAFKVGESVSEENLALLDADVLGIAYFDDKQRAKREGSPAFQRIPAVADGRYFAVPADSPGREAASAMNFGMTAANYEWTLDAIANDWFSDFDPASLN